jgi:hypothetical protein
MPTKILRIRLSRSRIALLAVLLLLASVNLGWSRHKTRGWNRCGIPAEYDYQTSHTTPPAKAVSALAVLMIRNNPPHSAAPTPIGPPGTTAAAIATAATPPPAKLNFYQLEQTLIVVDQCSISRVAVVLQQDGGWRVSLQADQNPKQADGTPVPVPAAAPNLPQKQVSHIKRNEFHVVVRGYSHNQLKDAADRTTLGKPLMFRLNLPPFWVQNGVPRDMAWDGVSQDVADYFELVDRVEVDLSYR